MSYFLNYLYFSTVILFIILAGFFSSMETAFICTEVLKIKSLKRTNPHVYNYLNKFFSKPEHFLATTLVGTNFCIIISSAIATLLLINVGIVDAFFWVSLILTPIVLLFGELIPKKIGMAFRSRFIIYFLGLFKNFEVILRPIVYVVEFIPSKILKFFFGERKPSLNKDDIKILTETLHSQGSINRLEREAIEDILGLCGDRVKDILVPFSKVMSIDYEDDLEAIIHKAKQCGFTRYPVFKDSKVLGYLNIFDIFYETFSSWHNLIRKIPKIGMNQRLDDILSHLQARKENIALVYKRNDPCGIITMQDVIREVISSLTKK